MRRYALYDVDDVIELGLARAWLSSGQDVPLFNCTCGDAGCGGVNVDIATHGDTTEWVVDRLDKPIRFQRDDLHRSLQTAMSPSPN